MSMPAGDLEDLGPPGHALIARPQRSALRSPTTRARLGLFVGAVVFTTGALAQLFAIAWFGLLLGLLGGSAEVLVHTGGLDRRTFAVSSVAAIVLDAVILLAISATSVRRVRRPHSGPERFAVRHPFAAASAWLVIALAFVTACGWTPSPFFPYPIATIVVLANAYWFALVAVFAMARLADHGWRHLKTWGIASEWRAGFLTASLVLAGAAGYWLLTTQWYTAPLHRLHARLAVEDPDRKTDVLSSELDQLCLAAGVIEPALVRSAPACDFLDRGTRRIDRCFSTLMTSAVPQAKRQLRRGHLGPHDVEDTIMSALLVTCTREPPPDDLLGYFFALTSSQSLRTVHETCRMAASDPLDNLPSPCSPADPPEIRKTKLGKLWNDALCRLDDDTAEILHRRLAQDESFGEIGAHLGITETAARDSFYTAIEKLRTLRSTTCGTDWF